VVRFVQVGPAPRGEAVWPEALFIQVGPAPRGEAVWPEALFIPGEAPVLPVLARSAPVPGIRSTILIQVLMSFFAFFAPLRSERRLLFSLKNSLRSQRLRGEFICI
jgi:hypothetical protein